MEIIAVSAVILLLWTNNVLFPSKPERKPAEDRLADDLKELIKDFKKLLEKKPSS